VGAFEINTIKGGAAPPPPPTVGCRAHSLGRRAIKLPIRPPGFLLRGMTATTYGDDATMFGP
jgi:hypothetical protein